MLTMKQKLNRLEALNAQLMTMLNVKSRDDTITDHLGKEKYFESESDYFFVENGIVFHLRKKDIEGAILDEKVLFRGLQQLFITRQTDGETSQVTTEIAWFVNSETMIDNNNLVH